ncbi:pentatricopeptide repeat-containing protein 2, mitochondrial isoform X2 [Fopius arisanus]|uniref:Pentatricopeptide repeat-containing protein 2, mitochondrial isoform X2 n=1 Tax=Fopius arisanus TaxID=64838 RepID=A0A9R1TX86_9HYME|nr:PREDICTED: pentatricopeptide repeat-containing protein 2, mitochondrial-like isoform X2 [Fopius arisanus]
MQKLYIFLRQSHRCRSLYTESALDLTDYKNSRKKMEESSGDLQVFRQAVRIALKRESNSVTLADLRKILHIVEKNEEDLTLLKTMMEKWHAQGGHNEEDYSLGPIIMRAFHYLNEPLIALDTLTNPQCKNLYDQPKSSAILVDLLYEHQMYKEVRDVYDFLRHKPVSKLVTSVVVLACYKENSPDSLQFALKMWKDVQGNRAPLRRTIVTLAALALNQNEPQMALQFIDHCRNVATISARTAKVMALCDLNRIDHVLLDFRYALKHNSHYLGDVVWKFHDAAKRMNIDSKTDIFRLFNSLRTRRSIQTQTLEEYISTPIDVPKKELPSDHQETSQLDRRKFDYGQNDWHDLSNRKCNQ